MLSLMSIEFVSTLLFCSVGRNKWANMTDRLCVVTSHRSKLSKTKLEPLRSSLPGSGIPTWNTFVVISQTYRLVSQERLSPRAGNSAFIDLIPITPSGEWWFQLQIHSWCVTPHSSPGRGCWQCLTIFNILNIFIIIR